MSTVATPVDGPDVSSDEDHSLINKFDNTSYFVDEDDNTPPSPPLLPLPDPNTPAVSFLFPTRPSTKIPILSTLSLRRKARRKRELVISDAPFLKPIERPSPEMRQDDRAMSEYDRRVQERDRRYNAILKWLRRFGTVRQVEQQSDGSLVVSWKDWDVADRVNDHSS